MPLINIPGFGPMNFPDTMSKEEIGVAIRQDILPQVQKEGFGAGLGAGIQGLKSAGLGLKYGITGSEADRQALLESQAKEQAKYQGPGWEDVKEAFAERGIWRGLGRTAEAAKGTLGQSLPYLAAPVAAAALAPATTVAGVGLGTLGFLGTSAGQYTGQNVGRQVQEQEAALARGETPQELSMARAAAASVPAALLDRFALGQTFKGTGLGRLFGQEGKEGVEAVAKKIVETGGNPSRLGSVLMGGGRGIAAEIPNEVGQQILERAQAGLDLTSDDAIKEYKEAAFGATLLGGGFGGMAGMGVRGAGMKQAREWEERAAAETETYNKKEADRLKAMETTRTSILDTIKLANEKEAQRVGWQGDIKEVGSTALDRSLAMFDSPEGVDTMLGNMGEYFPGTPAAELKKIQVQLRTYKNRMMTQIKEDAKKGQESAFTQNLPDLLGEYRAEPTSALAAPAPAPTPELQLTAPQPAPVQGELNLEPQPTTPPRRVDATFLKNYGIKANTAVAKNLSGLNLDDAADVEKARVIIADALASDKLSTKTQEKIDEMARKESRLQEQGEFFAKPELDKLQQQYNTALAEGARDKRNDKLAQLLADLESENAAKEEANRVAAEQAAAQEAASQAPAAGAGVSDQNRAEGVPGGLEPSVGVYERAAEPSAQTDQGVSGQPLGAAERDVTGAVEATGGAGSALTPDQIRQMLLEAGAEYDQQKAAETKTIEDEQAKWDAMLAAEGMGAELEPIPTEEFETDAEAKARKRKERAEEREAYGELTGELSWGKSRFSEGREGGSGVDANEVRRNLQKSFSMPARFNDMVTVVQSVNELPNIAQQDLSQAEDPTRVQAFVGSDGRIYMVADNIVPGEELGVFLHELGAHVGMEGLIGAANVRALTGQIMKWADMGNNTQESQIAQRAMARAEASSAEDKSSEVIAYFVEEAVKAGVNPVAVQELNNPLGRWFRKLWAAAKVGLRKIGMGKIDKLTTQNIVDLAYGAAHLELSGTWHGTAAEFRKFNHEYMGTGEGAQVYGWGSYLAQRPGIAHGYWQADTARKGTKDIVSYNGVPLSKLSEAERFVVEDAYHYLHELNMAPEAVLASLRKEYAHNLDIGIRLGWGQEKLQTAQDALTAAENIDLDKIILGKGGELMRVSFNANENELLDWDDVPNKHVLSILEKKLPAHIKSAVEDNVGPPIDVMEGGELYAGLKSIEIQTNALSTLLDPKVVARIDAKYRGRSDYNAEMKRAEEIVSTYLDSLGIKGTRYLDAESRDMTPENIKEYTKTFTLLRDSLQDEIEDMRTIMDNAQKMGENQAYQKSKQTYDFAIGKMRRIETELKNLREFKPTRNIVVFNDKNIVRAVSYKGAEKGKVKFSEATTPDELFRLAGGFTPTSATTRAATKIKNTIDSFSSVEKLVDKINNTRTRVFSSDTKFNARLRDALKASGLDWKELMLTASTSQALHRGGLAERFLEWGTLSYNKADNRWDSKHDETNVVSMGQKIKSIADELGRDALQVKYWVGEAWVAKRLQNIGNEIGKLEKEIDAFGPAKNAAQRQRQSALTEKLELLQRVSELRTPEQLANGLALYDYIGADNMKALDDMKNTMRKRVLDMLVDTQVMSREKAETFLENAEWVPFYRVTNEDESIGGPAVLSKGLSEQMKEKKLKGATGADDTKQVSGVDNLVKWLDWSVRRAVANQQKLVMVDQFKQFVGDEIHEGKGDKGYTISVMEDGQEKFYHFDDPLIAEAFTGMLPVMVPGMKGWRAATETLRKAVTRFPLFPPAQIIQDTYDAMFTSGLKHPTKLLTGVLREIYKTYKGESTARETLLGRGILSRDYSAAAEQEAAEVLAGLKDQNWWEKLNYKLEKFSSTADHVVRQAVYNQAKAEGLSEREAIEKATEIINFRRQGSATWVNWMRTMIPFFGAYLQVQNVALKTLSGEGISPTERKAALATIAMTAAKIGLFSTVYAMIMGDDDDYKNMDRRTRDRMILIPGTDIGISIRPNVFATPKIFAEHAYGYLTDNGTTDGRKIRAAAKAALVDSVLPSSYAVPQLVRPALEVAMDHNIFLDKPIVGNLKNLEKAEQFTSSTSELAKLLGSSPLSPWSPVQWDHLLRGYLSSVGSVTMLATNDALAAAAGRPRPDRSWQDTINSIPNMGNFVTKEFGTGAKTDFYELAGDVEKVNNTVNRLTKQGRVEEVKEYLSDEENKRLYAMKSQINTIQNNLAKVRAQKNLILQAPETRMSSAQKEVEVRRLNEIEQRMLKNVGTLRAKAGY